MERLIRHLENMKSALELAAAIGEISLPAKANYQTALDEAIQLAQDPNPDNEAGGLVFCGKCGKIK